MSASSRWYESASPTLPHPITRRTFMAALIPPGWVCSGTINTIYARDLRAGLLLVAVLNSFVFEYIGRPKIKTDTRWSTIRDIPVPLVADQELTADLEALSGRLSFCHESMLSLLGGAACLAEQKSAAPLVEPDMRAHMRAKVDAIVADLYGIPFEEYAYVLTTFPSLDRSQPAVSGDIFVRRTGKGDKETPRSYITRDVALLEYCRCKGVIPPDDIVAFYDGIGVDISRQTGPSATSKNASPKPPASARLLTYRHRREGGRLREEPRRMDGQREFLNRPGIRARGCMGIARRRPRLRPCPRSRPNRSPLCVRRGSRGEVHRQDGEDPALAHGTIQAPRLVPEDESEGQPADMRNARARPEGRDPRPHQRRRDHAQRA